MSGLPRPGRLLPSVGLLAASQAGAQLLNLAALLVLARLLTPEGFGTVQLGVTISAYALLAADLGLLPLGIRSLARARSLDEARAWFRAQLGVLLPWAFVVFGLGVLCLWPTGFFHRAPPVYLLYLACVLAQVGMVEWASTGLGDLRPTGLFWLLRSAVYAALVFALLPFVDGLWWVPLFYLVAFVAGDLAVLRMVRRRLGGGALGPRWPGWTEARARVTEAAPIGVGQLVLRLFIGLDVLLLGVLAGEGEVGQYAAAAKLVYVLFTATEVLWKVLLPRLSQLWAESPARFAGEFSRAAGAGVGLLAPVAVGGALLSVPIIDLLYGDEYARAAQVLRSLVVAYPLLALGFFFGQGLIARDRQRRYAPAVIVAALLLAVLLWRWIPGGGAEAAAHAVLLASALFCGLTLLALWSSLRPALLRALVVAAAGCGAMGLALQWLGPRPLWLAVPVGAAVYVVVAGPWLWPLLRRGRG